MKPLSSNRIKVMKIKKLDLNLFEGVTEELYRKCRAEYIASQIYEPGGLFSMGTYRKNPVVKESEWNERYPEGYDSWENEQKELTSRGNQTIIDKVNEIIDFINLPKTK